MPPRAISSPSVYRSVTAGGTAVRVELKSTPALAFGAASMIERIEWSAAAEGLSAVTLGSCGRFMVGIPYSRELIASCQTRGRLRAEQTGKARKAGNCLQQAVLTPVPLLGPRIVIGGAKGIVEVRWRHRAPTFAYRRVRWAASSRAMTSVV